VREPICRWHEQHPRDCQCEHDRGDPAYQPSDAIWPSSPVLQHKANARRCWPWLDALLSCCPASSLRLLSAVASTSGVIEIIEFVFAEGKDVDEAASSATMPQVRAAVRSWTAASRVQLDEEPRAASCAVEPFDGGWIRRRAVVHKEQRPQALPQVQGALKIGSRQPRPGLEQIAPDQPLGEVRGAYELVLARALEVPEGVDEGLNQPQISWSGPTIAGLALRSRPDRTERQLRPVVTTGSNPIDHHQHNGIRW
jgi:hypothetical protein